MKKIVTFLLATLMSVGMFGKTVQQDISLDVADWGWGYNSSVRSVGDMLECTLTGEWGALSTGWDPALDLTGWDKIVILVENMSGCDGEWFKLKAYLRDYTESESNQMEGLLGLDAPDNELNYLVIDLHQDKACDLTQARVLAIQCQPNGAVFKISRVYLEKEEEEPVQDDVPSDAVLANYYNQGEVCVCIYVPADMACNDVVLVGAFNNWSANAEDCAKFVPVDGFDGWYVTSFVPEENPDAEKGIQAKPVMLDIDGNFNWDYQAGAATVIRGGVQVISGAYAGEIDIVNYGTDAPNVYTVDAWKHNPCTAIYHNYTLTVISEGCEGHVVPFLVGAMTEWQFTQMDYDMAASDAEGADIFTISFKAAEGTPYQIVSGLIDELGEIVVEPEWADVAYMQQLVGGTWMRIPGEDYDNQLTHEDANIVWDLRADDLRWARCTDEPTEYVVAWINLPVENRPEAGVEIIGGFDGWEGTAMELRDNGWFFVELEAKPSQFFKFRGAGTWDQELELYDAENDEWRRIMDNEFVFGQLWSDDSYKGVACKMIELDLSDPEVARWTTTEPVPCVTASGTCGENLTWKLNCEGVLTISGIGEMERFSNYQNTPWRAYRESIKSIVIEEGVTTISEEAFAYFWRDNSVDVYIPSSVIEIGSSAFIATGSAFYVDEANSNYSSIDGVLFNKDQTTLIAYPIAKGNKEYFIPNTVQTIAHGAFYDGGYLTYIEIPNSVITIEPSAFRYCRGISSISIPNSVVSIGYDAFEYCDELTTVNISSSVASIGNGAFAGNVKLQSINVDEANPTFSSIDGVLFNKDQTTIILYPVGKEETEYAIPNTVTTIGYMSFAYLSYFEFESKLTSIIIPNSVRTIEYAAFWDGSTIKTVTNLAFVPQAVPEDAFNGVNLSACTLYVPAASLEAYKAADVWKDFGSIIPIGEYDIPTDAELANYYNQGEVCVCIYVPADLACNDIVLTGAFNGWSSNVEDCARFIPVDGYDGWYVTSFVPEDEPDEYRGIQAKPVILDINGQFSWDHQANAATIIRGDVQIIDTYYDEIDFVNYGTDAPNVFTIDAWKQNPCTEVFHNYTITVVSDGCDGYVVPFLTGSMTNWNFQQMKLDESMTLALGVPTYYYKFRAAEGAEYQIVSGLMNEEGRIVEEPAWSDEAYIQQFIDGEWVRLPGENWGNLMTHEEEEILIDLRAEDLRWARCAPEEPVEYTIVAVKLPTACAPDAVDIIGNFDGWAGTQMELLQTGWWFVQLNVKASQSFKFRSAGSWDQELEIYDAENDIWRTLSDKDFVFGQLWSDDTWKGVECKWIELDLSDPEVARWNNCSQEDYFTVSLSCDPNQGTVYGSGSYSEGSYVTISAEPYYGYYFVQWSDGNTANPRRIEVTQDIVLTAEFAVSTSGWCGDNLKWAFNDGVLTITGKGDMWNEQPWYLWREQITKVNFPSGLTSIGDDAFYNCTGLTELVIPASVTSVSYYAFYNCYNVVSFEGPACAIESGNFYNLRDITINSGYLYDFYYIKRNSMLRKLNLAAAENEALYDYALSSLNLTELVLPAHLWTIGTMAIAENMNLQQIEIPASVVEISKRAFEDCRSLAKVTFKGENLQVIGDWAFYNCHELASINLPEGIVEIGKAVFYGCAYMQEVHIPASMLAIGDNAFALCSKLNKMEVDAVIPPTVESKTFFEVSREAPVYVPDESVETYLAHPIWGELNIIGRSHMPQGLEQVNGQTTTHKILRDGHILILRGDKTYTVQGQEVK